MSHYSDPVGVKKMSLTALICSEDVRVVRILGLLLSELSIQAEHVPDPEKALESLRRRKFDGIFAESEDPAGAEILRSVKRSKHNKRSIVFALSNISLGTGAAFDLGAHLVIQRPIMIERVKRTLKAAHGLMMREQRLHFRHPASSQVTLRTSHGSSFAAKFKDLSQGGALLDVGTVLNKDQQLHLRFTLPETDVVVEVQGRVLWSDWTGQAGIRFESVSEDADARLMQWVIDRSVEAEEPRPMKVMAAVAAGGPSPIIEAPPTRVEVEKEEEALTLSHEFVAENMNFEWEVVEPPDVDGPVEGQLRSVLRRQHHAPVKVLAFSEDRPIVAHGSCSNLSCFGLAADLDEELNTEDPVLLQVTLPFGSKPMMLHAQVRHKDGLHYGFEFMAMTERCRALLQICISDLPVE